MHPCCHGDGDDDDDDDDDVDKNDENKDDDGENDKDVRWSQSLRNAREGTMRLWEKMVHLWMCESSWRGWSPLKGG